MAGGRVKAEQGREQRSSPQHRQRNDLIVFAVSQLVRIRATASKGIGSRAAEFLLVTEALRVDVREEKGPRNRNRLDPAHLPHLAAPRVSPVKSHVCLRNIAAA